MSRRRCCCTDSCIIVVDFLKGPTLSDTWTLKDGSWTDATIVDNYTRTTGTIEAWHITPHPDDPYPSDVRLRVRGATDSILRIILSASGDVATGDALIVELAPGAECGTMKLYQRQGGVEDVLATLAVYGAVVDEWHDLRACYDPETTVLTGSILPHDETSWRQTSVEVEAHTDGEYAGFASGTDDASDFDSFEFRKLWYDRVITPVCPTVSVATTQGGHAGLSGDYHWVWSAANPPYATCQFSNTLFPSMWEIDWSPPLIPTAFALASFIAGINVESSGYGFDLVLNVASIDGKLVISGTGTDATSAFGPQFEDIGYPDATKSGPGAYPSQNEKQTISISGDPAVCPVLSLTFGGESVDVSSTVDAGAIQTALESLSGIGTGNVSVSLTGSQTVTVEFVGALAETNVGAITAALSQCWDCLDYSYYYEPETERVTCAYCQTCCVFSVPLHPSCDMTVISGEWENIADTFVSEISCIRGDGQVLHSSGAGSFRVETTLPIAQTWGVTAIFLHLPYDETRSYRIDFDNGDYVVVDWSGTGCGLQISLNGSIVESTTFGPCLMPDQDEFELGVEICRASQSAINVGCWARDYLNIASTSCGATVTGITSDWDDIKVSVTVQEESWIHISSARQADGYSCYRCSQCICRPTIKSTVRVAFGNFGWTEQDACDNAIDECGGGFLDTVELSSEYDDIFPGWMNDPSNWLNAYRTSPTACRFAGVIYPWWTQPKETYTRMLLDVETGNKYYEKESHGERYMVAPYINAVTDTPAYVPSMAVLSVCLAVATNIPEAPVAWYVYVITSNAYHQYASGEFKAPYWSRECEGAPEPAPYIEKTSYLIYNGQPGWRDYDIPAPIPTGLRTLRWYYLGEEDVVKRDLGFWCLWKHDPMKCEDLGEHIDLDLCESDGAPENPYSYCRTWVGGSESLPTPTQDGPCSGTFPDTVRLYF